MMDILKFKRDQYDANNNNTTLLRMHLAVRAYEELLLNLVHMEDRGGERVQEAGRVIRLVDSSGI